ncbi:MAG: hypothetical protein ING32_13635 [Curvibacter sp.]|nr:hypothetical protein [Curvibacter sp.]
MSAKPSTTVSRAPDLRLRYILSSQSQHLHACAGETRLTEQWCKTIDFLKRTGYSSSRPCSTAVCSRSAAHRRR